MYIRNKTIKLCYLLFRFEIKTSRFFRARIGVWGWKSKGQERARAQAQMRKKSEAVGQAEVELASYP